MYQAEYSLILYPSAPTFSISQEQLISILKEIELLGNQESQQRYQTGESFLSLLCFMGCSPDIELFPQKDDQPYCYLEIPKPTDVTQCVISKNVKVPRCPHCKADLIQLSKQLKQNCTQTANCYSCTKSIIPSQLNWRKTAFFAKNYILIGNIYEAEAIPDQKLLDSLEQSTQVPWLYAYIRS